ncbi:MAG TPA: dihydropyrimidinase [Feifaniaceae bacterium]|nr:dihydropyrimidinase [Feifaniaceae bacterium]
MRYLIKNGLIINADGRREADLLIGDGRILAAGKQLEEANAEVIDASGCYVFPGFIDPHTHFDLDLGVTVTADNFVTGTKAAVLGGTTTVLDFATPVHGGTLRAALEEWHKKAEGSSCNYGFHMALAEWNENISREMDDITKAGVTSYKMYMVYPALRVNDGEIYLAMQRGRDIGALISMHCENYHVLNAKIAELKAAGNLGPAAHPLSRPAEVEAEAVSRYLRIAQMAGSHAYVVHLSTGAGFAEARQARARGQEVYLETCPQYLVLDSSRYDDPDGAKYVMSPPLRAPEDQDALWKGLAENGIDTVGTDHCSFTMEQKALGKDDFTKIPNGGAGVQNRAALYYTYGVLSGRLTLEQMAAQLSSNAAKLFGCTNKGVIAEGADADVVVWDPRHEETISYKTLAHNCDNSPYEGFRVRGRARDVLVNGEWTVRDGSLRKAGLGRYVFRGPCQGYRK